MAKVGDFELREDMLRFRFKLELDKFPKAYVEEARQFPLNDKNKLKPVLDGVFDKMIEDYSLLTYAAKRGITLSDNELAERFASEQAGLSPKALQEILREASIPYHRFKQLAEDQIRVRYALDKMIGDKLEVTLNEIRAYYNAHRDEFRNDEEVRVRHIVTDSRDKAADILQRIRDGENFAKLAVNHSISPDRARGGDLGYYPRGVMPVVFDTVFKMQKGEVSGIVQSEYGFHIFKLIKKRPAGAKPFEEATSGIQRKIFESKLKSHYKELIAKVLDETPVTVFEDNLRSFIL